MLTSTDDIVGNAILIEAHKDKYKGTTREDKTLLQTDVFLSAFSDGKRMQQGKITANFWMQCFPPLLKNCANGE